MSPPTRLVQVKSALSDRDPQRPDVIRSSASDLTRLVFHDFEAEQDEEPETGDDEPAGVRLISGPAQEGAGTKVGRYELIDKLGEGGFGIVWRARQTVTLDRLVALKIIKAGMDSEQVIARFNVERQALAKMDHPGIAHVLDAGATDRGRPYFVMELVDGPSITAFCDLFQLPVVDRIRLFIEVCLAVQHAHQKGILHRDLKPSNILVIKVDGVPRPKIIDFGIAKAMEQEAAENSQDSFEGLTQADQVIGTPAYMSPEQALSDGLDVDTRADIYTLGVILFELLTGRTPLEEATLRRLPMHAALDYVRRTEAPRPSTIISQYAELPRRQLALQRRTDGVSWLATLKGDLDWITLRALEHDRDRRYPSAAELAADLTRCLNNEPVLARPPTFRYQAAKFIRRHRVGVAASAIVVCALIAAVAVSTVSLLRESRMRAVAEEQRTRATEQSVIAEANAKLANEAAQRASEQSRRAEKTLSFLTEMLEKAGDFVEEGKNPEALRLAVDSAAASISHFDTDPEIQAEINGRLAAIYESLGSHGKALELLKEQFEFETKNLGRTDATTLNTLSRYARSAAQAEENALSLRLFGELIARWQERSGDPKQARGLFFARRDLGRELTRQKLYPEAVALLASIRPEVEENVIFKGDIPSFYRAYANALRLNGSLNEAEEYYQKALSSLGPELKNIHTSAMIHQDLGRLALARFDYPKAAKELETSIELDLSCKGDSFLLLINRWIEVSRLHLLNGDTSAARNATVAAVTLARTTGQVASMPRALRAAGLAAEADLAFPAALIFYRDAEAEIREANPTSTEWFEDRASYTAVRALSGSADLAKKGILVSWKEWEPQSRPLSDRALCLLAFVATTPTPPLPEIDDAVRPVLQDCTERLRGKLMGQMKTTWEEIPEKWRPKMIAGDLAANQALPESLDFLALAEALGDSWSGGDTPGIQLRYAAMLRVAGRVEEAIAAYEFIAQTATELPCPLERLATAEIFAAECHAQLGHTPEARAVLDHFWPEAPNGTPTAPGRRLHWHLSALAQRLGLPYSITHAAQ